MDMSVLDGSTGGPGLNELLKHAQEAVRVGRLGEAQETCQSLIESHPDQPDGWYLSGLTACAMVIPRRHAGICPAPLRCVVGSQPIASLSARRFDRQTITRAHSFNSVTPGFSTRAPMRLSSALPARARRKATVQRPRSSRRLPCACCVEMRVAISAGAFLAESPESPHSSATSSDPEHLESFDQP